MKTDKPKANERSSPEFIKKLQRAEKLAERYPQLIAKLVTPEFKDAFQKINMAVKKWNNEFPKKYEVLFKSLEHFLKKEGKILPIEEEFSMWYLLYTDEVLKLNWFEVSKREIEPHDFELFHQYMEKQYKHGFSFNQIYVDKPKQPLNNIENPPKPQNAKILMEFVRIIENATPYSIYPKASEYSNNDEKFQLISKKISDKFKYQYKPNTLEGAEAKIEGYSLDVFNLLNFWNYDTLATKYNAKHNK